MPLYKELDNIHDAFADLGEVIIDEAKKDCRRLILYALEQINRNLKAVNNLLPCLEQVRLNLWFLSKILKGEYPREEPDEWIKINPYCW